MQNHKVERNVDLETARKLGIPEDLFSAKAVDRRLSRPYLDYSMTVLDIGGGTGIDAAPMATIAKSVVILDVSHESLRRGKMSLENIEFVCASGVFLPFRDNSFGMVTCFSALDHFPRGDSVANAFAEFQRVLKPGGKLAVTGPNLAFIPVTILIYLRKLRGRVTENRRFLHKQLHKIAVSSKLTPVLYDGAFPSKVGNELVSWLLSASGGQDNPRVTLWTSKRLTMTVIGCLTRLMSRACSSELLAPRIGILALKPSQKPDDQILGSSRVTIKH